MVSIIVPVYRSEQTLTRCVESLLAQDYRDIEILLIVDGPPDGSGVLADALAQTDDRIRVIHQPNQGVSRARNQGLEQARGEYIRFVDSDDYVQPKELSLMVQRLQQDGTDMVIAGFHHLYYGRKITRLPHMDGVLDTRKDFGDMRQLYADGFLNVPWNKLFVRSWIIAPRSADRACPLAFEEDISLGEDLLFNQSYIMDTDRISVMRICVCEYVQDDRGTTLSTKGRDDKIDIALLLYRRSAAFFGHLYAQADLTFLKEKVVTTFLDEMECLGFQKGSAQQKREFLERYMTACRCFVQKNACRDLRLRQLDYRLLFFFVKKNQKAVVRCLIVCRTHVVSIVRILDRLRCALGRIGAEGEKI